MSKDEFDLSGTGTGGDGGSDLGTEDGEGFTVDLGNTSEEGNFEAMPRGMYDCRVDQLTYGQSQRSGNNMWTVVFAVEGGEYANRKLFYHLVFVETGMPRVKRFLARIKSEDDYAKSLLNARFSPEKIADEGKLLNATCRVRVDVRNYEGTKRNDVKDVLPPSSGGDGFATA